MGMTQFAFFRGAFVPINEARLSIMSHVVNYGTGCFEGIRAYWSAEEEQLYVFRMPEHYRRLLRSSHILRIEQPYSTEQLGEISLELLRREGFRADVYLRPLSYKGSEGIGVRLHDLRDEFSLFAVPFGQYLPFESGVRVCVSSWRRVSDNAIPARAKIVGAYANSALAKTEAHLNGFDEAIVLGESGHVSEASAANLFLVRDGQLVTPPATDDILEGITRHSVMTLAQQELGIATVERPIDRTELYAADEAFFCGTGVAVVPIGEIDHRRVGQEPIGPITAQLMALYDDTVRGRRSAYRHWCTPVYP
ncbi:MAG: branched-chain amino acid transaminase [Chloroflexi bacterium]|nr:branched-chain amino acid transaminase [Chloroflexota bacterium]